MNSGVNASLRFAFTSNVEKGAFYNRKQVKKNQKGEVIKKREVSSKGYLFIKREFVYQRCFIKERVYMKKGKGESE